MFKNLVEATFTALSNPTELKWHNLLFFLKGRTMALSHDTNSYSTKAF